MQHWNGLLSNESLAIFRESEWREIYWMTLKNKSADALPKQK